MLAGRRCADCGQLAVDDGQQCPFCGEEGATSVSLSGQGRLLSWTVIRIAPARYAGDVPYAVGLVELDEGGRLTARLTGDAEGWRAGQRVALIQRDASRGPVFQAANG